MKPSLPKGTRDFNPAEMVRRNYILDTIRSVYRLHGYLPIETPAMENLAVLEGKYGEEGDKLLFRVLNSGPVFEKFSQPGNQITVREVSEKGLRFDLTVPFARYVVMHRNDIVFPFKRYQIQPVWRADRPQKGRYREFYQCDADVIGSDSLLNEVEMVQMISEVFERLGLNVTILLNNRKILAGLAESFGEKVSLEKFSIIIDKLDKVGLYDVMDQLRQLGLTDNAMAWIKPWLENIDDPAYNLAALENYLFDSNTGMEGLGELKYILAQYTNGINYSKRTEYLRANLKFHFSLARGLDYYTGTIFEVKLSDPRSTYGGSLLGGGRYDNLTGIFGMPGISGVGISFGIDRIYDVMEELDRFGELNLATSGTQVLFVHFGPESEGHCLEMADRLRRSGVNAEFYPDPAKLKKQMAYADARNIPWVVLIGSEEIKSGTWTVKNMETGEQETARPEQWIQKIANG